MEVWGSPGLAAAVAVAESVVWGLESVELVLTGSAVDLVVASAAVVADSVASGLVGAESLGP